MSKTSYGRVGVRLGQTLCLGVAALSSGCASLTHYNTLDKRNMGADQVIVNAMDAKQRIVFTRKTASGDVVTCAEPSPDALSALAAAGGLSVTDGGTQAGGNGSISEAAAMIGLRTQSIQLMRDAMYRLCEGYANGALSQADFQTLHRRFQTTMVTNLAIEQLTGTVTGPAAALGGSAQVGDPELAALLIEREKKLRTEHDAAKAAEAAYRTGTHDPAKTALDQKKAAIGPDETQFTQAQKDSYKTEQDAFDTAKTKLAELEADTTAKKGKLDEASRMASQQSQFVQSAQQGATVVRSLPGRPTDEIAKQVAKIVESTNELGFGREVCATVFTHALTVQRGRQSLSQPPDRALVFGTGSNAVTVSPDVYAACLRYLDTNAQSNEAIIQTSVATQSAIIGILNSAAQNGKYLEAAKLINALQGVEAQDKTPAPVVQIFSPSRLAGSPDYLKDWLDSQGYVPTVDLPEEDDR